MDWNAIIAFATALGVVGSIVLGVIALGFSRNANHLAKATAAQHAERWNVTWAANWDEQNAEVVLLNSGSDTARDLRVTITGDGIHVIDKPVDLDAGLRVAVKVPQIPTLRDAHYGRVNSIQTMSTMSVAKTFTRDLAVLIEWRTGLGRPESRTLPVHATDPGALQTGSK